MAFFDDHPYLTHLQDLAKKRSTGLYLVGGFLRDLALGQPCLDYDFTVEKKAVDFARVFARKIKGAFVLLDQEHGCARVVKKIRGEVLTFDFAGFRAPSLQGDLLHRDFTINAMACDIQKIKPGSLTPRPIKDPSHGREDLNGKVIRMVSKQSFKDDPLRLLRAFSLRASLKFKIEKQTLAQIKQDCSLIRTVSFERIRDELFKVLETPQAGRVLKEMDRVGLLEKFIPQISVMHNVRQGTYHHLDVWPHSLETVVQVDKLFKDFAGDEDVCAYLNKALAGKRTRRALIKLAALLHDIGKPETLKKEPGRISFHAHERVGKNIVREIALALKLSTRERFAVQDMVLWHLRPGYLSNFKKPSERAIFRFLRDAKQEAVSIALLSLADQRSTRGPMTTEADQKHHEKICMSLLRKYFEKAKERPFVRLISGDDLIQHLHLQPSPFFAKILMQVEELQVMGKIKTKKEALAAADKIVKSHHNKKDL